MIARAAARLARSEPTFLASAATARCASSALAACAHDALARPALASFAPRALVSRARASLALHALALLAGATPALAQCELHEFQAPQPAATELFGDAVALDGGLALIGAWLQDPAQPGNPSCNSGAAHLYRGAGASWTHEATLVPASAACGDYFGSSLDLSGGVALVGAPGADGSAGETVGRAHVFELRASGWVETASLRAPDAEAGDAFGSSVALHGDWLAVGAPGHRVLDFDQAGAVYLFERGPGGWRFGATLVEPFYDEDNRFGSSLDLHGDRLVVGAPGEREGGVEAGAVYTFLRTAGGWQFERKLVASDARAYRRFGSALALHGDALLVGAPTVANGQLPRGRAYVFEHAPASGWSEAQRLLAPDSALGGQFGQSLALGAQHLLIGAAFEAGLTGAAYSYRRSASGAWEFGARLRPRALAAGDYFAVDLALEEVGARANFLVGASADDDGGTQAGAAYLFESSDYATSFCACSPLSPCGNFEALDGCRNSSGRGARLTACGGAGVAADALQLRADGLPSGSLGILVVGARAQPRTFADGVQCLGVTVGRYPAHASGALGQLDYGPGLGAYAASHFPAALHFLPGRRLGFQLWFRDQGGPCASGANWSSALEIELAP